MNRIASKAGGLSALLLIGAAGLIASCATMAPMVGGQRVELKGENEVPPVTTTAAGTAVVDIKPDRSLTATVTVTGMTATASHIHEASAGANGPVIVPFTKTGDNTFEAAAGAKMTPEQLAAYKAGNTYVNVHSAKHPNGEVRAQLAGR